MNLSYAGCFTLFMLFSACASDGKRPFYIIGHMVNSIEQIRRYLDRGANVIETDIQFHTNGSVREAYHGFPCDCFRTCNRNANLQHFLEYVRNITDPYFPGSYGDRMVMQFFDLKLGTSANKRNSGKDLARHVLDYLWSKDGNRKQEIRALMYIESIRNIDFIHGFIDEFKRRGVEERLNDVGFDGGEDDPQEIRRGLAQMEINGNIWQGDGKTNCISAVYPDGRLRRCLAIRDSESSHIKKVYHWTIDLKLRMRMSLNLGVDGMITNDPEDLVEVLQEAYFRNEFRLATPEDDPFARYEGKSEKPDGNHLRKIIKFIFDGRR